MDEKRVKPTSQPDPKPEKERDPQHRGLLRGGRRGPRPRSKFAPLDASLDDIIAELATLEGVNRRRAELYLRARRGGTALELEFIRVEKNLLNEAEKSVRESTEVRQTHELGQQLEELTRRLAARHNSSALRADMAIIPPPRRGKA